MTVALGLSMLTYSAAGMAIAYGSDLTLVKALHSNVRIAIVSNIDDFSDGIESFPP